MERASFGRLSVFAGGWTLEAAEQVCSGRGIEHYEVLDLLVGLVEKSLVVAEAASEGAVRYKILEPIRQYASDKLDESGEAGEVQERHAAFFLVLAERAELELAGSQQRFWVERLDREHDNFGVALLRALEHGEGELALRLGAALWRFWFARGYYGEGTTWLEQVLAAGDPKASSTRVKAIEGLGWLTQRQGDTERAEATYAEMLELSRKLDDEANVATALNSLGTLAVQQGDHERATPLLEENLAVLRRLEERGDTTTSLKMFHVLGLQGYLALLNGDLVRTTTLWEESLTLVREVGDTAQTVQTLSNLGYAAMLQGDHVGAKKYCEDALVLAGDLGSAGGDLVAEPLINLGLAARDRGEHERAATSFKEALAVSREAGNKPSAINALEGMASLAGALEEDIRAGRLWGGAKAARDVTGLALLPGERTLHEPYLVSARTRLGERKWDETLSEGRAMSLEEASEYALSEEKTDPPAAPVPERPPAGELMSALTRREEEVAALVALGFTNREISTRLSISERTAGNHVGRILKKLGLGSRTQVATWAIEHGLSAHDPD
ncbi:MAG TPA: tetratricopeptide repeat protein, partial [Rubrobacter sp.]|nr:tetratricopeptide repeat protein [Rubrobacter sp.]